MRLNTFTSKSIKSFVLALIAPIAFLCFFLYFDGKDWFDSGRESTLNILESKAYDGVSIKIETLRHELDQIAEEFVKSEDFYSISAKMASGDKNIDNIFYISHEGKVISFDKEQSSDLKRWFKSLEGSHTESDIYIKPLDHGIYFKKPTYSDFNSSNKDIPVFRITRPVDANDPLKGLIGIQIEADRLFEVYEMSMQDLGIESFVTYKGTWFSGSVSKNIKDDSKELILQGKTEDQINEEGTTSDFADIYSDKFQVIYNDEILPQKIVEKLETDKVTYTDTIKVGEYSYRITPLSVKGYYGITKHITDNSFAKVLFNRIDFAIMVFLCILMLIGIFIYNISIIRDNIEKFTSRLKRLEEARTFSVFEMIKDMDRYKYLMESLIELKHFYIRRALEIVNKNEEITKEINHLDSRRLDVDELIDSTEKVRMELIEKRKGNENLIDNISDIIWCFDQKGRIILAGNSMENVLGYEEGQLYELNISDIIYDAVRGKGDDELVKMLTKRNFEDIELHLLHSNGVDKIITSTKTVRLIDNDNFTNLDSIKPTRHRFKTEEVKATQADQTIILAISRDITKERQRIINNNHKSKELLFANDINRIMSTNVSDMSEILKSMTDRIRGLLNVSFSVINTLEDGKLKMVAYAGYNYKFLSKGIEGIEKTNIGVSITENKVLMFNTVEELYYYDKYAVNVLNVLDTLVYLPLQNKEGVIGVLTVGTSSKVDDEKLETLKYLAHSTSLVIEKAEIFEKQKENYYKTITALTNAMEQKLYSLRGHAVRVADISTLIGERMFLRQESIRDLKIAGLLHDIGKIGIEDKYLMPDPDSDISGEKSNEIIRNHPEMSGKMIEPIGLSHDIYEAVVLHHLRYDLKGYPRAADYKVDKQPVLAQIIQIADAFENRMADLIRDGKREREDYVLSKASINEFAEITVREFEKRVGTEFSGGAFRGLVKVLEKDEVQVQRILGDINADE